MDISERPWLEYCVIPGQHVCAYGSASFGVVIERYNLPASGLQNVADTAGSTEEFQSSPRHFLYAAIFRVYGNDERLDNY